MHDTPGLRRVIPFVERVVDKLSALLNEEIGLGDIKARIKASVEVYESFGLVLSEELIVLVDD